MAPLERRGQEKYEALWDEIRRTGFVRMRVDGQSYNVEEPPAIDHRRKHAVEVVVDRLVVAARPAGPASPTRSRRPSTWAAACLHVAHVDDKREEPEWKVERFSQHFACDRCGRSFEPLNPHHFSFNSPLGWCPTCEGLGVQKGANPALLIRDPQRSLRDGAVAAWPPLDAENPFLPLRRGAGPARRLLARHAVRAAGAGPAAAVAARHRRGLDSAGEPEPSRLRRSEGRTRPGSRRRPRFQYKGLFPAIDEASRVSFVYRHKLDHLVSEVPCSDLRRLAACATMRRPAASQDHTLGELCDLAARAETLALLQGAEADQGAAAGRRRAAARDHATACSSWSMSASIT